MESSTKDTMAWPLEIDISVGSIKCTVKWQILQYRWLKGVLKRLFTFTISWLSKTTYLQCEDWLVKNCSIFLTLTELLSVSLLMWTIWFIPRLTAGKNGLNEIRKCITFVLAAGFVQESVFLSVFVKVGGLSLQKWMIQNGCRPYEKQECF